MPELTLKCHEAEVTANVAKFNDLLDLYAAMPLMYRLQSKWILTKDAEDEIKEWVDNCGQKIWKPEDASSRLLGLSVIRIKFK